MMPFIVGRNPSTPAPCTPFFCHPSSGSLSASHPVTELSTSRHCTHWPLVQQILDALQRKAAATARTGHSCNRYWLHCNARQPPPHALATRATDIGCIAMQGSRHRTHLPLVQQILAALQHETASRPRVKQRTSSIAILFYRNRYISVMFHIERCNQY